MTAVLQLMQPTPASAVINIDPGPVGSEITNLVVPISSAEIIGQPFNGSLVTVDFLLDGNKYIEASNTFFPMASATLRMNYDAYAFDYEFISAGFLDESNSFVSYGPGGSSGGSTHFPLWPTQPDVQAPNSFSFRGLRYTFRNPTTAFGNGVVDSATLTIVGGLYDTLTVVPEISTLSAWAVMGLMTLGIVWWKRRRSASL